MVVQVSTRNNLDEAERLRVAVGAFVRRVRTQDQMPAPQASALGHLHREGPLPITTLAERDRVRHQSMARTVKLLRAAGLVDLGSDHLDGRKVVVTITSAGQRALDSERQHRAAFIADQIETSLSAAERLIVGRIPAILDKLARDSESPT